MSPSGHKRTPQDVRAMSALPPKADIDRRTDEVTLNDRPRVYRFETTPAVCDGDTVAPLRRARVQPFYRDLVQCYGAVA